MAFPTGWAWKAPITIPAARISGSNSNFPVLLTEANFPTTMMDGGSSSALNGGGDVRFSEDAAGTVQLPCEIVSFVTGGTPSAEIWVKLPTLNSGADKTVYVWYKNAGQVQPLATDPFGRNAVWAARESEYHFQNLLDSTGNADLTANGIAAISGGAATIGAASSFSAGTNSQFSGQNNFSIHFKGNTGTVTGTGTIYPRILNYNPAMAFGFNTGGTGVWNNGWTNLAFIAPNNTDIDCWLTYDGATYNLYNNGVLVATALKTQTPVSGSGTNFIGNIAAWDNGGKYWPGDGNMDDLAIIHSTISANWIATEYTNQSSPATFATAGTPVASGGGTALTVNDATSSHMAGNVTLSQAQSLLVNDAAHDNRTDQGTFSQILVQTVDGVMHGHMAGQMALSQGLSFSARDASHVQTSDNVTFAQIQALIVQNATHGIAGDSVIFNPAAIMTDDGRTLTPQSGGRTASPISGNRKFHPTDNRTLRI